MSESLKPGNCYALLGRVMCHHLLIYVKEYKGYLLFFDFIVPGVHLISHSAFEKAIHTNGVHPIDNNIKMLNFIEKIPDDVFEVVEAEVEKRLLEKEPEILNIFPILCVKN